MNISCQRRLQALLLLTLFLVPGRLGAQEPQSEPLPAEATAPPSTVPELAEIIPLATAVAGRLASLERAKVNGVNVSQVETQLAAISALVEERARQFLALQNATDLQASQLPQLKADINRADDSLVGVSKAVRRQIRTLGNLRKAWLDEQQQWSAWQAAWLKDEPLEQIATTVTRTQEVIEIALGLLRQRLRPLLGIQEEVGTLQIRINDLTTEVEDLLPLSSGDIRSALSPAMFSAEYFSQFAAVLRMGVHTDLLQITSSTKSFFVRQGWIIALQGVLSLILALAFVRHRPQLEQVEHWRFVAKRPVAAGLLVGIMSVVVCYESPPDTVRLVLSVLVGIAFVRLLAGLVIGRWHWQFVYGLLSLSIMTNLCYALGLSLTLFRLYILTAALVSLLCCLHWAAASRRLREARLYAWVLRLAAVLLAVVLFVELRGETRLAEFLFVSLLRTLATVLVFGLLRYLIRGGLEWAVRGAESRYTALFGDYTALVVQRLALVIDILIGVVILFALLMTWQVYDSPGEAITGLLSIQATIGSQQITVGLVMLAVGVFEVSYLASWMLQMLLTKSVLARRNVDTGVAISVTRLFHYALVTMGFVLALVVLGVNLTQITLLASALSVGIGFGLQTIVNNFVCGLILLLERPLRVGDTIELGEQWANIIKIGLRATTVRTFDQADIIIPNTDLITNQVTNWTLTDRRARSIIPVGVAYGSDVALVMQTLKASALAHPIVIQSPEPQVLFRGFGESSLNFELRVWIADVDTRLQVTSDLHQDIDRRFRQSGIAIPFPQRDLHVRSVKDTNTLAAIARAPRD